MSAPENTKLTRETVAADDIDVAQKRGDSFKQTDRSTLMAFMRNIRAQDEHAIPATVLSTPVPKAALHREPQMPYRQNDRTTLRTALDRMAANRENWTKGAR